MTYLHIKEMPLPNRIDVADCIGRDREALFDLFTAGTHVERPAMRRDWNCGTALCCVPRGLWDEPKYLCSSSQ